MARTVVKETTFVKAPGIENEIALLFKTDLQESDMLFETMPDGRVLIGYLIHDEDASNPMEDQDGNGKVYTSDRHASKEAHHGFQEAMGLDAYWEPNLNLLNEADVVKAGLAKIHGDPDLFLKALEHCRRHWTHHPAFQTNAKFVDDCLNSVNELTPVIDIYSIEMDLWREGRKNGTIGNKYAVPLDVYEHGLISYSISGTGPQCQFDTAKGGAVWVPDDCAIQNFEDPAADLETNRAKAREYAKSCVEEYTAYVNGDTWGAVVQYSDGEQVDETMWSLIGHDAAKKELIELFNSVERKPVSMPIPPFPKPEKHDYTQTLREGRWEVKMSPTTHYGYYEHDIQGEGGGLWFDGNKLRDFDGRSCLPRDVATALLKAGYELEHNEYVGDRIEL
jgi:hypothetical protein